MKVEITEITVNDVDVVDIENEWAELQDADDVPTGEALTYYTHTGHRVYLKLVDENGEETNLDLTTENLAVLLPIQDEVNAAIVAAGADSAELGWGFSSYAYCGQCPCSPGFLVAGTGPAQDAVVTVKITGSAAAAA